MQLGNNDHGVLNAFLAALGLTGRRTQPHSDDPVLAVEASGRTYLLQARPISLGNAREVDSAVRAIRNRKDLPLEITPVLILEGTTTSDLIDRLTRQGVSWVDAQGRGRIRALPGLFLAREIAAEPVQEVNSLGTEHWTSSSGAVVEAILNPRLYESSRLAAGSVLPPLSHIAAKAAVTPSQVSRVLARFDAVGWTAKTGAQRGRGAGRVIENPGALLREWSIWHNQRVLPGRSGHILFQGALEFVREQLLMAYPSGTWCVSGEVAAELLAPHATAVAEVVCYVDRSHLAGSWADLLAAAGAREVQEGGNLRLMAAERHVMSQTELTEGIPVVNPVRVFGDLIGAGARGPDLAEHLRRVVLGF